MTSAQILAPYPDVEAAVIELLTGHGATVDVETPADLNGNLPFIRVTQNGGNEDRITATARIGVDVFAASRTAAKTLADDIEQILIAFPHTLSNCVLDEVTAATRPSIVPWNNTSLRLSAATYVVTARRAPA